MDLPRIGKPAPNFTAKAVLEDKVFDISLSDYNKKYVVLLFFPMDFAYVCPTELIAFSDHVHDFHQINTDIIACSVESHLTHLKWLSIPRKEAGIRGLQIPLIADKSMSITKQYGILDEEEGFAYRATFIIDDKGILRQLSINDRPVGRDITETRRLIQALQYADKIRESTPKLGFLEVSPTSVLLRSLSRRNTDRALLHELME